MYPQFVWFLLLRKLTIMYTNISCFIHILSMLLSPQLRKGSWPPSATAQGMQELHRTN